ncbi:T9SS type A sorting domain-containing protein [Psychroserpens sp. XS_ASV72]|uniref:T9SS type A sorting domain-containing protein n=1 Tax=Psychroserpens sp. XS_ASV72 TaxID=3241293 RepID=UPI0035167E78
MILLLSCTNLSNSQTKAFPSVQGAGSYVTGGRGGIIVKVTNLNNSGPGSLRSALMMTVPRTIVFDVSGTIVLTSAIELIEENSNFTVAGQTAPEGGITISNHLIQMGGGWSRPSQPCNNAIWRYIRFRNGRYNGQSDVREHNGFLSTGCEGLVFDHCSFSFCDDQAIAMGGDWGPLQDITIQNCVFSENATGIIVGLNPNYPTGNMTSINNLFVDQGHRTPNVGGGLQYDIINNVFFNWGSRLTNANSSSPEINFIGNYLQPGDHTLNGSANKVQNIVPSIYTANNYHSTYYQVPQLDDRDLWQNFYTNANLPSSYFTTTMHPLIENPTVTSAQTAFTTVLANVGANKFLNADGSYGTYRDSFDILKINNVQNNISSDPFNKNWTLPSLPQNSRPGTYDTDNDGMADVWEIATFGDLTRSHNGDEDGDGYTNVEEFINGTDTETNVSYQVEAGDNVTICEGESTTLVASEADSYVWMPGNMTSNSINVSPASTTTYTVTGTHADGSTSSDQVVVTVNPIPVANAGVDVEICQGESVTLTAEGGTSYLWNTGQTTESITVSPNATFTYSVVAIENGCNSEADEIVVTVNPLPNVDAGLDVTINYGESIELNASGADSYVWNTGETTQSITVNPTIETTYTVTGSNGNCENSDSVTVFLVGNEVVANAGEDQTICNGSTTTLTATGGTAYVWNTGETTASIEVNPTQTTTYTVTVFDITGTLSDTDDVIVTVNELPNTNAGSDVAITEGESVTLTATGADSYEWSTGETTSAISVSPNTTTTYTVTGFSNGCESTDAVVVTVETETVVANAGADVEICSGAMVTLTASGGTSYEWSTGETTQSIEVSPNVTTTYSVTVFNTMGTASDTDDVIVTVNELPNTDAGSDVTITEGESVTLTATGADSYEWSTGETTSAISVSPNTTTTYTVTGFSNGCESTDAVVVTVETETVVANAGADVEICSGTVATLTASGGTSYEWSTGETTQSIEVSPNVTTTYSVTVFNTMGTASDTDDVIVTVNDLPNTDAGSDVTITEGESVTLTATGADSYEWSTGETTSAISVSPNTTTTYTVTGFSNGCESTDAVVVTVETETVVANAGADVEICSGAMVTLTASGGTSYEWSTGETTQIIEVSPNVTTTYSVTVFNTMGTASDTDEVTVTVNDLPVANAGADVEICLGASIVLVASGGTDYLWSTGESAQSIEVSPNSTTEYSVEVFDNGCSSTDEVIVTVNELPNTDAGSDITITEGESVTLTATGADSYEWSTGETTSAISVSPNTTTTYTVTGFSNGCQTTDEVTVIVEPIIFEASAGEDQFICEGTQTTLTASEGDSYLWSTGETTQSITVSPWETETYTVTVFEDDQQAQDDVTVFVNLNPNVVIMNGQEVTILEGEFITLSASGANLYEWSNGATQPNIAVSPSSSTTFSVTGFINNCSDTKSVTVNVVGTVEAYAGEDQFICNNETVTLTATGGDEFLWSTGETTPSIEVSPNEDTEYSVVVYNALDADEATVMVFVEDCSSAVILPEAEEEFDFNVYQDATADIVKVKISGLQNVNVEQIMIYDLNGKIIYSEQILQNEGDLSLDKEIDSSLFSRGIYVIRLMYNNTELLKKVLIR